MKLQFILVFLTLNIFAFTLKSEKFTINYYHKGIVIHTQQVEQDSPIGTFPNLDLKSCNDRINIFAGWIAENDIANYQTANSATPTFITEKYKVTANINLYATFADGEASTELAWRRVEKIGELSDLDSIIIVANNYDYAIGKAINSSERLTSVEITKSDDNSIITPNENVQIFTLNKVNNLLWALQTDYGYLGNQSKENSILYYAAIKDWTSWGITIDATTYSAKFNNNYTSYPQYLYFHEYNNYFACKKTSVSNLAIYKQKKANTVNYIVCSTPDATEYTITLHDGNNTAEIKCMNNNSIEQPTPLQTFNHWQFYGWATSPIDTTTNIPEIIKFPYTPTGNIDLYAVYFATTADSLIIKDKIVPASWIINETRNYNSLIALYKNNYISTPQIDNITQIEVEMKKDSAAHYSLYIISEIDNKYLVDKTNNDFKKHLFKFDKPISSPIKIISSSSKTTNGIIIKNLTIHHTPIYTTKPQEETRHIVSFKHNTTKEHKNHYSISQRSGGNITLPTNSFINDLDFLEWNTNSDGLGKKYPNNATIKNITADITLYAQWGIIKRINSTETFNINTTTEINRLTIESDKQNSGKIKIEGSASLAVKDKITIEKTINNHHYHFFSLPYDCSLSNITATDNTGQTLTYPSNATEGDYIIYRYDQTLAANNAGDIDKNAWIEILDQEYILKANQGYIVGYFGEKETIKVSFSSTEHQIITAPTNKTYNFGSDYEWYTAGENLSANGWNLIGQPYYETLRQGDLTQYVTIPNSDGKTYTQCLYLEALIDGLITPFSAFFVQLKDNVAPTIKTEELDYALYDGEKGFGFIDIYLSSDKGSDRTSLFNADHYTADYEIGCDLKKWIGYADRPQIYTIERGIPLAYNIRRIDETTLLSVGIYAPFEDEYIFSANENCGDLYLVDKQENITINLSQENYEVWLPEGKIDDRFEFSFQQTTSTQSATDATKIEYFVENGTVFVKNIPENAVLYIYDYTGKMVDKTDLSYFQLPFKGVYHIIVKIGDKKQNNFCVIY